MLTLSPGPPFILQVPANTTTTFIFTLAWHFPNRYTNWSQAVRRSSCLGQVPLRPAAPDRVPLRLASQGFGIQDTQSQFWLGNQYANFWPTITEVGAAPQRAARASPSVAAAATHLPPASPSGPGVRA